jgi:hypothetical protein
MAGPPPNQMTSAHPGSAQMASAQSFAPVTAPSVLNSAPSAQRQFLMPQTVSRTPTNVEIPTEKEPNRGAKRKCMRSFFAPWRDGPRLAWLLNSRAPAHAFLCNFLPCNGEIRSGSMLMPSRMSFGNQYAESPSRLCRAATATGSKKGKAEGSSEKQTTASKEKSVYNYYHTTYSLRQFLADQYVPRSRAYYLVSRMTCQPGCALSE